MTDAIEQRVTEAYDAVANRPIGGRLVLLIVGATLVVGIMIGFALNAVTSGGTAGLGSSITGRTTVGFVQGGR
jgi:hypothetical protein